MECKEPEEILQGIYSDALMILSACQHVYKWLDKSKIEKSL